MKTLNLTKLFTALVLTITFNSITLADIIPLSDGKSEKFLPASEKSMMGDNQDGILICWLDEANNGSLFIQKINKSGKNIWTGNGIMVDSYLGTGFTASADYPSVYSDNEGGALVIYRKIVAESEKIYCSKVTSDGSINDAVCLSSFYEGHNFSASSVYTSDNCIAVVWENFNVGNFNIHAQKISMNGNKLWNGGKETIVCREPGDERKPNVICDESNNFVITWLDNRNSGQTNEFGLDLYANKLDENGNFTDFDPSGKQILSYSKSITHQNSKSNSNDLRFRNGKGPKKIQKVAYYNHNLVLSDNNSVIIAADLWHLDEDSFLKIFKLNENLDPVWENIIQAESFQYNPLIVTDGNFGACLLWNDNRNNEAAIYAALYDKYGNVIAGDKAGSKVSNDIYKNYLPKELPDRSNKNGICFQNSKLTVPFLTKVSNILYSVTFDLLNSSPFNCVPLNISNGVKTGEGTSVNYLDNEAVTVFLKENIVYASVNIAGKKHVNSNNGNISLNNFPNPFNPVTKIRYEIPFISGGSDFVTLKIYDMDGKEVASLVNENKTAGIYEVTFNGNNLSSGTYFAKISAGQLTLVKKIILLK